MTPEQVDRAKRTLALLANAIVETVSEAGSKGAPASAMYLAFSDAGISLNTFQALCNALVAAGQITCRNHCYYRARQLPR